MSAGRIQQTPARVTLTSAQRKRRLVRTIFKANLALYVALSVFWFLVNMAVGGQIWFIFPMLGYGLFVAIHLVITWLLLKAIGVSEQAPAEISTRSVVGSEVPAAAPVHRPRTAEPTDPGEMMANMKLYAEGLPNPEGRSAALEAVNSLGRVVDLLPDLDDEPELATQFVERLLKPSHAVLREYAYLADHHVSLADATLRDVREHDLPRIAERADAVYERLHRGAVIDLDVAREMLSLELDEPMTPALPRVRDGVSDLSENSEQDETRQRPNGATPETENGQ